MGFLQNMATKATNLLKEKYLEKITPYLLENETIKECFVFGDEFLAITGKRVLIYDYDGIKSGTLYIVKPAEIKGIIHKTKFAAVFENEEIGILIGSKELSVKFNNPSEVKKAIQALSKMIF